MNSRNVTRCWQQREGEESRRDEEGIQGESGGRGPEEEE